ncbi:MAG: ATP synthase F1 subunit epsilon, partial [Planctomycetes bacterium]|nr:ATP synthase F1 subunit epsilon [Planctomycetota bacterium]
MAKLTLRVITPDRIVLDTQAEAVRVPATDGSMGFLPRHAHLVAALDLGLLTWREGGKSQTLFVSGGFVEVKQDTVRVVSEAGERPSEIDVPRAREAEKRARERLDQGREAGAQV